MTNRLLALALAGLTMCFGCTALPALEEPAPPRLESDAHATPPAGTFADSPPAAWWSVVKASFVQPENDTAKKENGNGDKKEGPDHIRDNGFFVEEASNQEPGVVQHIFNWINFWDQTGSTRTRDFLGNYTMELPLGTQKHQFSFTVNFITRFEQVDGETGIQQGDIGDTFLNYRYQLLANDDFLWCAPRFSLIVPSGDKRLGTGTGEVGYQFNLPVSRYGENFDFHFNAGTTFIPHVAMPIDVGPLFVSPRHDLHAYNLGASMFWKPKTDLHFFVETLALWTDNIDDRGARESSTQVLVNPGLRFAVIQEPVEWVLGFSVPVGLTHDSPDIGFFAYMSIEHSFRKKKNGNGE